MNNEFDYNKTYYKITNKEENHNGFQFKDGLNEDIVPFNTEICSAGGIYFSDIKNILRYLSYSGIQGYYVREVKVPKDAEVSIETGKYKASKIILGKRKELNLDTIKYLVEQGADIHVRFNNVLRWSSKNGYDDIVRYLVEQGADVCASGSLIWSAANGHLEVVKCLVELCNDIQVTPTIGLVDASRYGHLKIVQYLVEHGADIHTKDEEPLQLASENGHLDVVKYLVEQGADIHADDELALECASENGHLEVVKYLVEQGADIHIDNDKALVYAQARGWSEVVSYLQSCK